MSSLQDQWVAEDQGETPDERPLVDAATFDAPAIWSLAPRAGQLCGLPLLPVATAEWGARVLEVPSAGLVWGWTPPGRTEVAERYPGRVVADVELRQWKGRAGEELAAEALAALTPGVTSHGYVAPSLARVLGVFAKRGRVGVPQVYDPRHRYGEPRAFLRRCVESYRRAGFDRVVPLLGTEAGGDYLRAWIDEAERLRVPWHVWTSQSLRSLGCDVLRGVVDLPGDVVDVTNAPPRPSTWPEPAPPRSPGGLAPLLLLLGAAAYARRRARDRR